jgi:hypothetical protein
MLWEGWDPLSIVLQLLLLCEKIHCWSQTSHQGFLPEPASGIGHDRTVAQDVKAKVEERQEGSKYVRNKQLCWKWRFGRGKHRGPQLVACR